MSKPKILIAGIGNIFFGDDAFGVEVARRLAQHRISSQVKVVDFGIRGFDLAYALFEGYELVILVDAAQKGQKPGTLFVIDPATSTKAGTEIFFDTHGMVPTKVLEMARAMGDVASKILLVCCEPATFGSAEEGKMGLSKPVEAAIDPAIELIENLISKTLAMEAIHA